MNSFDYGFDCLDVSCFCNVLYEKLTDDYGDEISHIQQALHGISLQYTIDRLNRYVDIELFVFDESFKYSYKLFSVNLAIHDIVSKVGYSSSYNIVYLTNHGIAKRNDWYQSTKMRLYQIFDN